MPDSLARKDGNETISARVPALPHQETSTRFMPRSGEDDHGRPDEQPPATRTSSENHSGAAPSIMMPPTPTMNSRRSAVGSSTLPSSLTWWK